jgi:hypothetical protein
MKTAKIIVNVFSLVFFFIIILQSCATGLVNAWNGNEGDSSGAGGAMLALFILVAGIVGLATRKNEKSSIAVGILYLIAAIIGFSSLGTFGDLVIWASLSLIFACLYFASFVLHKKSLNKVVLSNVDPELEIESKE